MRKGRARLPGLECRDPTSLGLNSLICKMGIIVPTSQGSCEDLMRKLLASAWHIVMNDVVTDCCY